MNRTTGTRAVALVLALAGTGLAAGCGDSDTTATTATSTPTVSATTPGVSTVSTTPALPTTLTVPTSGLPTVPAPTTSTVATAPVGTTPGGTVSVATFVTDVQAFAQTLTQFGLTLQAAADGPDALRARGPAMRGQLDRLDGVVARMAAYRVDVPLLEQRRAAIVAASPDVSRLGRELLDAAEAGDASRVQQVAQEFTTALTRLQTAAGG